jgi:hypothetical protein
VAAKIVSINGANIRIRAPGTMVDFDARLGPSSDDVESLSTFRWGWRPRIWVAKHQVSKKVRHD